MYKDAVRLDPSVRSLHAFLTVVEEGHFGKAAARLYLTGPALSQQIRRLEQQLGLRLIDRESRPLAPTEAGEVFLPHAHHMLQAAQEAALELQQLSRRRDQVLRVGFINGSAGQWTTLLLSKLHCRLELTQLSWAEQFSAVASGAVDAAFVRPPIPELEGLRTEQIATEPRVAILPTNHPLAGRRSLAISELDDEVHIGTDALGEEWLAWWTVNPRPSGARVKYGHYVNTMDEEVQLIAAGLAIGITAASIGAYYPGVEVVFVPIHDIEPCSIELCTRVDAEHPGVDELRRVVAELDSESSRAGSPSGG